MNARADLAPSRAAPGAGGFARSSLARVLAVLGRAWPSIAAILPRASAFVLALALTATVTDLALRLVARRVPPEPVQGVMTGDLTALTQPADVSSIAALLGAQPDSGSGDIKLLGVIAQGTHGGGIALLSLDGKPARAARAGRQLAPNLSLVEVRKDRVLVNRAGALLEIRMTPKPAASTGAASPPLREAPSPAAAQPAIAAGTATLGGSLHPSVPPPAQPAAPARLRGRRGSLEP